jgi:site-specific recombinase XerD
VIDQLEQTLAAYDVWLDRQPLAASTQSAYRLQVHQYGAFLAQRLAGKDDPLHHPFARDYAVRDYKTYLKTERKAKPTSVNLALAAIDHFYQFLGSDRPKVQREDLPKQSPRALKPKEQKTFLRAVERASSVRDQAIARLLLYTGLRLSECAALNVDDIGISARKGIVIVRSGKGDTYREVPLNAEVRETFKKWIKERTERFHKSSTPALFLNLKGKRLSTRAIDLVIRQLGSSANLEISAHVLRHTCFTNLVRGGNDLLLVAEIAGHKRVETTRRYSLPSLPGNLLAKCRDILIRCDEFSSNETLETIFVTSELAPYRQYLPRANSVAQRVDACLDFLSNRLYQGKPLLEVFLQALLQRYPAEDDLHAALEILINEVHNVPQPSSPSRRSLRENQRQKKFLSDT